MAKEIDVIISKRVAEIIEDSYSFKVTLTKELEELGIKKSDSITISVISDNGKKKILIEGE